MDVPFAMGFRRWLTVALPILALAAGVASAQEEIVPEPAVRAPLAGKSLLLDATVADGHFVVVGERGHILTSADNGGTWQQSEVPSRGSLTGSLLPRSQTWVGRWATTR